MLMGTHWPASDEKWLYASAEKTRDQNRWSQPSINDQTRHRIQGQQKEWTAVIKRSRSQVSVVSLVIALRSSAGSLS